MKSFNQAQSHLSDRESGGTTFLALFMLALILFIGATVLLNVTRLYNGSQKVEGWQEALNAAEAGADLGLANLRWTVVTSPSPVPSPAFNPSPSASPSPAIAWTKTTTTDPTTGQITNTTYTCTTPHIMQTGEGTSETWAVVTVDSPIGDNTTSPPSGLTYKGNQWWRIRSTGHARIPGLKRVSTDILTDPNARHSNALRKFGLVFDRSTGATLSVPEATRTIEVLAQPKTAWQPALLALTSLSIDGTQRIDSYDPANGAWSVATAHSNGNVGVGGTRDGTNITTPGNSALSIASGEKVYGSASTNGGNFTDQNRTIQSPGTINNSINVNVPGIPIPTWGTAGQPSINGSVTTITAAKTITVSSDPTQNYYKIDKIYAPLTVALPAGVTTGTLNIWLTTGLNTKGAITIPVGVTVKIYLQGDQFHPGQNGSNVGAINNLNQDPSTFQLYGVGTSPGGSGGGGIDLHVGGTGVQNFYGTVYAPYRPVIMKYDGNTNYDATSAFYGSFIADTIALHASLHYDEALNGVGDPVIDYDRSSYVEDPR